MRQITKKEKKIIEYLTNNSINTPDLVRDLKDGSMGSISFDLDNSQLRKAKIAAAKYLDEDGILVDIELTTDNNGNLYELDFWKIDFSPLKSYPTIEKLKFED
jgi:hypothetical protein